MWAMMRIALAAAAVCSGLQAVAALKVEEAADGTLSILRDGRAFVVAVEALGGAPAPRTVERSFATAADGSKVWNRWSPEKEGRFRLEVVERTDGAVELSLVGEADGSCKNRERTLQLRLSKGVEGTRWRTMVGNGSRSGAEGGSKKNDFTPHEGTFAAGMPPFKTRWLETDGVLWDFNAYGPPANRHQQGEVRVGADGSYLVGRTVGFGQTWGGYGMTKLILREGRYEDYFKYHFLFTFYYDQRLPATLVSFGAPKTGPDYRPGDLPFDAKRGFGWLDEPVRELRIGHRSGAYYSHAAGRGRAVYRFANLVDGYYVMTFQAGNFTETGNRFSLSVNGIELGRDIVVPGKKARTVSRALRVVGGTADFVLDGDWIVSALAVQPLMTDAEDFTVRRGFWYVKGYEPSKMYHTEYYSTPCAFAVADETIDMPTPGEEASAPYREPPRPVELPDPDLPSLQWLRRANVCEMLGNASTLAELEDETWRRTYLDRQAAKGYNAVMMNAMLSRHTYPEQLVEYGHAMTARLAREFHDRGMKYIDHPDATLLWNSDMGFRVLMSRLSQTIRARQDGLPSSHLCPNNPEMKKWLFGYLRRQVEGGVDGFQIDECEFWPHGCTCKWCRERFHEETGWWYPLDETDPSVRGERTPLQKRWYAWRFQTVANWFVELRRHLKDLRPDLVLTMYNVYWNFMASQFSSMYSTDLLELGRAVNMMGVEALAGNTMQMSRPLFPLNRMFNVLNRLYGVPVFGFYYNPDMTRRYFCWAMANMLGQTALLGDTWRDPKVPDFARWGASAANMRRDGAEQVCEVALLFSRHSRDWNRLTDCYVLADLFGLAQELEAMKIPYEFIGDDNVNVRDLSKYRVLALGTAQCLSDAEVAEIKAFAGRGGRVLMCPDSGTRDEFGEPRREPAFAGLAGDPRSNVSLMPQARDFYCWLYNYGQTFSFNPDREKLSDFRRTMRRLLTDATVWRTQHLPEKVYSTIWRERDGALVVHFLNSTATDIRSGDQMPRQTPSPAWPAIEEDVRFALPAPADARACAVSPDFEGERPLETRDAGNGLLAVSLPKELLKAYTIVRIRP